MQITDDLPQFLAIFPEELHSAIGVELTHDELIEVVLDYGRPPVARFMNRVQTLPGRVTREALDAITTGLDFADDDRAAIDGTLHRISAIRNRAGAIIGLTCRVGRAIYGVVDPLHDILESGQSILLLGPPSVGKSTMLRDAARVLAGSKRVVVVDTSAEIGGGGDLPHPGIGNARRMLVQHVAEQAVIMQRAVENHSPEVIIVDEIGNVQETRAARTIAERGVQLIATAHGNALEDLLRNPELNDLLGGVQSVTLGDRTAEQRGTQKTIQERVAEPTFSVLVELIDHETLVVHSSLAEAVDAALRKASLEREVRHGGEVHTGAERVDATRTRARTGPRIAAYGLKSDHIRQAATRLGAAIAHRPEDATHLVVRSRCVGDANVQRYKTLGIQLISVRASSYDHILAALTKALRGS